MGTRTKRLLLVLLLCLLIVGSVLGGLYWYDNNVDRSGWVEKDGIRYYQDFHADPVSGWLDLEEGRYYFHSDGTPTLGWMELDGLRYYFGPDGVMTTGWLKLDGKTHYFGDNGALVEGWLWLSQDRYYLVDGAIVTGWQDIEGKRYYFDDQGRMLRGFSLLEGQQYYFDDEGVLATGLTELEDGMYLFSPEGVMQTGWQELEDGRHYFCDQGPMAIGWQELEDQLYYFDETGILQTGWLTLGEDRYYLFEDGHAAIGPVEIEGQLHHFSPKGIEVILVNALHPIPEYYTTDIKNVVGYHDVDARCYDALVQMLADCEAAGIEYTFNSAYRTIKEQTEILEIRTQEHMKDFDLTFEEARKMALDTVALPGTSEHNMGLAVDLLGKEAIAWFQEHCWDYGFILRYTAEKEPITGITDEPWHFRYVGKSVALDMKDSGLCLEEYLGAEAVGDVAEDTLLGD